MAATNVAVLWAVGDGADGRAPGEAVAARIAGSHIYRLLYLARRLRRRRPPPTERAADYREHYDSLYGKLAERTAPKPGTTSGPRALTATTP